MRRIYNLTQHEPTPDMATMGVLPPVKEVQGYITITQIPDKEFLARLARKIVGTIPTDAKEALIGGAPYLMAPLEKQLKARGIQPLYAFSRRVSEEITLPSGSVKKVSKFLFEGFIEV